MMLGIDVAPCSTGLVILGVCLACGTSGAQAGVETVRAAGVVWLSGGAAATGVQSGPGRASLQPSRGRFHRRQDPPVPIGLTELAARQPGDAAVDAPAMPFVGTPAALATLGRGATYGWRDTPRRLLDMGPVLPVVEQAAEAHRLDPALLLAVIHAESGFNAQALSPKGAVGLMQLIPATASRYGAGDLRDPNQNVQAGAAHLRYLLRRYGDLRLALAAYNAGEGAVERHGMHIPPYAETQDYVPRVLALYQQYRQRREGADTGEAPVSNGSRTWPAGSRSAATSPHAAAASLRAYAANLN